VRDRPFYASIAFSLAFHFLLISLPFHPLVREVSPHPPLHATLTSVAVPVADKRSSPVEKQEAGAAEVTRPNPEIVDLTAARAPGSAFEPGLYIPTGELTRKPEPLQDWDELAWRLPPQAHGRVVLTIYISASGAVDKLEYATPIANEFQEWIRDVLLAGIPFSPGERDGKPAPTRLTLQFDLSAIRR
jgi:outer membrane biosynthesis protein TonB